MNTRKNNIAYLIYEDLKSEMISVYLIYNHSKLQIQQQKTMMAEKTEKFK